MEYSNKQKESSKYTLVTSLQYLPYYVTKDTAVTRNGNRLSGSKSNIQSSIIGPELKSVCFVMFDFTFSLALLYFVGDISNVFFTFFYSVKYLSLFIENSGASKSIQLAVYFLFFIHLSLLPHK